MQGHNYANFALPNVQTMLLRGIAWAGKRPADSLSTIVCPDGRCGGGGGRRGGGRGRGTNPGDSDGRGRGGQ
jgi:hypothetical protein